MEPEEMSLTGISFEVVAPGTVVGKDPEGNDVVVTEQSAVFNGPRAWVTQAMYDALKKEAKK